jgi:hypothetical protein
VNQKDLVKCTQVQIDSVTFLTQWWIISWTKTWWVWDSMRDGIGKNSPKIQNSPLEQGWETQPSNLKGPAFWSMDIQYWLPVSESFMSTVYNEIGKQRKQLLWSPLRCSSTHQHVMLHVVQIPGSLTCATQSCPVLFPSTSTIVDSYCGESKKTHPQLSLILPFCSGIANCTQEWIYWCVYHCLITITNQLSFSLEFLSACPIYCNLP